MDYVITVKGREFGAEKRCGVFERRADGTWLQHRGTGQAGPFPSEARFRRFVQQMLRDAEGPR